MGKQPVIEAVKLTKVYDGFTAVDSLDLRVEEGEIFGFLGPNGAGKTTTILMLLGLTEPTSGMATVYGYNVSREPLEVKRVAGHVPENLGLYEDLTSSENIKYIARLNSLSDRETSKRIPELLDLVGLSGVARQKTGTFSRGMKQRLGIAGVLVKDPKVVFLDEPTSGLDPDGANIVLDLISRMSEERHITVLISSHLLPQIQKICHRVGILSKGHLVASGPIEQLGKEMLGGAQMVVELEAEGATPHLADSIREIDGVTKVEESGNRLLISCQRDIRAQISRVVFQSNGSVVEMKLRGYGLEEIYMRYFK
ncbi:ABC transporter ATP-binding protein [Chloroflexota bacterium]